MAQIRLHKVLHDLENDVNHFQHVKVGDDGLADINVATDKINTAWKDYEEVCVETHELSISDSFAAGDVPHAIVLRAHVRCCCVPCPHANEHDLTSGGAFSRAARGFVFANTGKLPKHAHAPGIEYVEAAIDLNTLKPLKGEAAQRVPNPELRKQFAQEIAAEAELFELTPADIEAQLGVAGEDEHGFLSARGAAAKVLAGEDTVPDDYYWVASFVILWQRLLTAAHSKITLDWPQRSRLRAASFGPRPVAFSPATTK